MQPRNVPPEAATWLFRALCQHWSIAGTAKKAPPARRHTEPTQHSKARAQDMNRTLRIPHHKHQPPIPNWVTAHKCLYGRSCVWATATTHHMDPMAALSLCAVCAAGLSSLVFPDGKHKRRTPNNKLARIKSCSVTRRNGTTTCNSLTSKQAPGHRHQAPAPNTILADLQNRSPTDGPCIPAVCPWQCTHCTCHTMQPQHSQPLVHIFAHACTQQTLPLKLPTNTIKLPHQPS
jgi:hypothetical protein